ncbi:nitroreductase family protein [Cupriavidus basilensis]
MNEALITDALIRGRHAKRGFHRERMVLLETVRDILAVAKYAPSSSNTTVALLRS